MRKMKSVLIILGILTSCLTFAQVGIGTTSPNADALVHLRSTNKGLLIPTLGLTSTTSPAPLASHVEGMVIYNTAEVNDLIKGVYYNTGSEWVQSGEGKSIGQLHMPCEYEGSTLDSTGTNGANIGCMSAINTGTANNYRNAYSWASTESFNQSYHIYVRVELPDDFTSWTSSGFEIDYKTEASSSVAIEVFKEDGTAILPSTILNNAFWTTSVNNLSGVTTTSAGDVVMVKITLTSRNSAKAQVSDIRFEYNK